MWRILATKCEALMKRSKWSLTTATGIDEIKWNQWKQLLRSWLSPADPSTNHNIAQKAQHEGTTAWFIQDGIVIEWKYTGSLLWIYGKPGSGKSVICSSVIQHIMAVCETGSAVMAYFYFDFRDLNKKSCHDLLRSLIFQLSSRSSSCCDILRSLHETHENGSRQPTDETLKGCLKEMLKLLAQKPIFIILDALDESPDYPGVPSPRDEVLRIVKELVDLRLQGLRICATSRPEVDIRAVLEPLAFRSVSLHDEDGQKMDISDYIQSVVNLSSSTAMRRWRAEEKDLVIGTLTERADGMFRWVYCQLETLRHCFPSNLRRFLNELPETLDETYDRILKGINRAQQDDAHRLLQCLTIATRSLRVEELAELLAFDFQASSSGGIPTLREDWRWDDQEEAVLSICSSLITIVPTFHSRVVQFSHFSVKEYLTSPRLAQSPHRDVSRFHINLESAHTIMAQACLATLLQLDEYAGYSSSEWSPLVEYAAEHWVDHAQFHNVESRIQDGMDDLFDSSKPHFDAWLEVHNRDAFWRFFDPPNPNAGSPLYYAAFCGFYDLAERLIMKHPEQVNAAGGRVIAPLPAALSKRHYRVADLLYRHGAVVDVHDVFQGAPLHAASANGEVDIMRWVLDHGADANACDAVTHWTPLHAAASELHLEAVQILLTYNVDVNSQNGTGGTPLILASGSGSTRGGMVVDIVRRLLEHGADPNIPDHDRSTPLHEASSRGRLESARLLLSFGAKVDEKNGKGRTPLQVAASEGHDEITKLLLEHGAVPQP
ncbi:ankyrin repeat-containing domain protein [Lactarius quietus]|nr:ankyrin repeat-containing domain protein [Lactarius quietus]